jgi:hypothetical protein
LRIKTILIFAVFILLVSNVYGFGIAPAKSSFEFSENSVKEGRFRIVSSEFPAKIKISAEGELGKYIELEKEVIILEQQETWVTFKLNLPKDLPPGERLGNIIVMEESTDTYSDDMVVATPAVIHKVIVKVPYPGKYLTGKMYITTTQVEEPVVFTIALANYGNEAIQNAKATIIIKGPTNEELAVLHTDEGPVNNGQEQKLSSAWLAANPGTYLAEATVEYDGKIMQLSEIFNVGSLDVEIERIEVNNFKIGQIAKIDIYMRNKWNKPIKTEGRVEIFKQNSLVSSFNTVPVDILEKSTSVMNAYWNTEGISTGEYDINVKTTYEGKTSEKTFTSYVSADNIQFKDFASGNVVAKKGNNNTALLIIGVFILIILNILLFIYINKKLKAKSS